MKKNEKSPIGNIKSLISISKIVSIIVLFNRYSKDYKERISRNENATFTLKKQQQEEIKSITQKLKQFIIKRRNLISYIFKNEDLQEIARLDAVTYEEERAISDSKEESAIRDAWICIMRLQPPQGRTSCTSRLMNSKYLEQQPYWLFKSLLNIARFIDVVINSIKNWIKAILLNSLKDMLLQRDKLNIELEQLKLKHKEECEQLSQRFNSGEKKVFKELQKKIEDILPCADFNAMVNEIYNNDVNIESFLCPKSAPNYILLGYTGYNFSPLITTLPRGLLKEYRNASQKSSKVVYADSYDFYIPLIVFLDESFNIFIKTDQYSRNSAILTLKCIVLKLFMSIPPERINFIFFDPIGLGETFAAFTKLGDEDQAKKIIDGKIWTSSKDIERRLNVLTDHIVNVTSNYLQGEYEDIHSYNNLAGRNAEPYKILVIMDFPANFNETTLRLLEQIIVSGPKCGVYTIIVNEKEGANSLKPNEINYIEKIEERMHIFESATTSLYRHDHIANPDSYFSSQFLTDFPDTNKLNKIFNMLKEGLRTAEKPTIYYDDILLKRSEWLQNDNSEELRIPIGTRGVNKIQYLSLGLGVSHHALIVGQPGSGKSRLLHSIIMSALISYSPEQLQIYLIDFKQGVEFKVYANYILPIFKVIATESEKEFAVSVLEYLDEMQRERSNKFKQFDVNNVQEYRKKTGETLPRVLLIIDEFQELFSSKDKNDFQISSVIMERIIRQGRAYGIHMILASQTLADTKTLSKGSLDQIAVRIALKCSVADAQFTLGEGATAIEQLPSDQPGLAVYNPSNGASSENSIFRVAFLEQEKQKDLLKAVESETIFNLDTHTRVMLSNIEDNKYHIFNKFIRIEEVQFQEQLYIGESLDIKNNISISFKPKAREHLLMMGVDQEKARSIFMFSLLSFICNDSLKLKRNRTPFIYMLDYTFDNVNEEEPLRLFSERMTDYIIYSNGDDIREILTSLSQILTERSEKMLTDEEPIYVMLFGLHRAREIHLKNLYENDVNLKELFINIIRNGSQHRIHFLIWQDNLTRYNERYPNLLELFNLRIAFNMPADDLFLFIDEHEINKNNAIYFSTKSSLSFRPYQMPNKQWVENIISIFDD